MAVFASLTNSLRLILEDGLGKCSQTVGCLSDKQEALDPIPGTATKEMGAKGEVSNLWVIKEPGRQ